MPSTVGQTRAAAEALLHDSLGFGLQETLVNAGPTRSGQVITQIPERWAAAEGLHHRPHDRSVTLARWYDEHGRHDLPWRSTRDRWAILVSEVMLHQTQVPRVAAVFDGFLRRFPTPDAMAAAGPGAVIEAWGRLGYPRRARRLYDAAVVIADARLAGRPP